MEPKALPPAKISPVKLLKGSSLLSTVKKISTKSIGDDSRSLEFGIVKKQVIQVSDLIKTNTLLKAKEEESKRKESEKKRFAKKEEELEKPKEDKGDKIKLPSVPRLGFLEGIKKFLFNIFLGYISLRLLPYLPKLAGVVGTIVKVQDVIIDWSGKILNGLVSFVDKGYEVYDKTRKFLGNLGGENFTKAFDGFVGVMDRVIEASIIAALAFGELRGAGDIEKPVKDTVSAGAKRGALTKLGRRAFVGALGKGGARVVLKFVKPFLKRLPIIGALIDFGLSVALGENPGRAAFKSIGAGLLGTIGAAVGAVGGPASIAGGILGGLAGDFVGGLLYDVFFGNKTPQKSKIEGRAQGGQVTRGGKYTGPVKRTIQKAKPKRTLRVQTTEIRPGQSIGGKDKIEKVFPEVETKEKGKTVNPLGYMKDNYKIASSIPGLGGLAALFMKAQLGERPSNVDYQIAADGLTGWMQRNTAGGIQRTGGAFAEGGEVDMGMFSNGDDMKNVIAKALQDSVAPKIDDMINDLMKQIGLKSTTIEKDIQKEQQQIGPGGEMVPGSVPRGQLTIEQLVGISKGAGFSDNDAVLMAAVAMAESSGNSLSKREDTDVHGLWQIRYPVHIDKLRKLGVTSRDQLYDPVTNAKAAKAVFDSQGITAWSAFTNNAYKRFLAQAQAARNTPSLATSPTMYGGKGVDGYITGDPSHPNYQADHSGNNYHDHLSFKDRPTAERAYNFFKSKGFVVTEFKGYGRVGRHSPGSMHYSGLAFDIPGSQVPVGQERQMSAKVRSTLSQFRAMALGGKVHGFTRAVLGEKGPEFVIDADSTKALEENYPGFLDALNKSNYQGALNVLRNYASYEQGAAIHAIVDEKLIPVPIPVGSAQQSSMMISIFDEQEDYLASSYRG